MKGQVKAGKGAMVGNAGEYYVVAELLKRNIIAAQSPRNLPSFDILATKDRKTVKIRVKTKSEEHDVWMWNAKDKGVVFRDLEEDSDFTVLVDLTMDTHQLSYYIIPTLKISEWLFSDFEKWVTTPGRNGRQRSRRNKHRSLGQNRDKERLIAYKDNWEILWGCIE